MGKRTVRKDLFASCPWCKRAMKPSNLKRHVRARHPEHLDEFERDYIRQLLRDLPRFDL